MSVADTAKHLNEKEKESLEVAEGARETEWTQPYFRGRAFHGAFSCRFDFALSPTIPRRQGRRRRVHGPP